MYISLVMLFEILFMLSRLNFLFGELVPILNLDPRNRRSLNATMPDKLKFLPFIMMIDQEKDTSEYWRETEILSLVRAHQDGMDYAGCPKGNSERTIVHLPSRRTIRPICKARFDYQICPQCPHFSNYSECELFRDSCRERKVLPHEQKFYCERKYGKWRTMFIPADYSQCRCCDECVFYRELDQSCVQDEYSFDSEEFLPVTTVDFRAGCNPYWGHPAQELRALRCHTILRRCVPVTVPLLPKESLHLRRSSFRFQPPSPDKDCPFTCRAYNCSASLVSEKQCAPGAFLPDKNECNCCGRCSVYQQLGQKCAVFNKTVLQKSNDSSDIEVEVEEEFLEPGCDDGLVCRQGVCQDIHTVQTSTGGRRSRREQSSDPPFDEPFVVSNFLVVPPEPCKREMKYFKKKYGPEGHLHFEAPQCTPLWLYSPVQCRRFVCYCALEDGTPIEGIKVPRVEVSNMNCDCAREKCRLGLDTECDGFGNYKEAAFTTQVDEWGHQGEGDSGRRVGDDFSIDAIGPYLHAVNVKSWEESNRATLLLQDNNLLFCIIILNLSCY